MYKVSAKDKTNKNVWAWTKVYEDGSSKEIDVSSASWKPERDWSLEELDALFENDAIKIVNSKPVSIPTYDIDLDDGDYE